MITITQGQQQINCMKFILFDKKQLIFCKFNEFQQQIIQKLNQFIKKISYQNISSILQSAYKEQTISIIIQAQKNHQLLNKPTTKMSLHQPNSPYDSTHQQKSYKIIQNKFKNDHFSYQKQLPVKKNISLYTSSYHTDAEQIAHHNAIQQFRKKIAPVTLNTNLLKRSLHESNVHYSPNKVSPLPNIVLQSSYKNSFYEKSSENSPKGKAKDGFFLKMQWNDSPTSNYRKSYQKSNIQVRMEKSIVVQGHLQVIKRKFKGHTNYEESYSPTLKNAKNDNKDCIKNKDHLAGVSFQMNGQTQYHSKYQRFKAIISSEPSQKQINDKKKKHKQFFLPKIKKNKSQADINKKYLQKTLVEQQIKKLRRPEGQDNKAQSIYKQQKSTKDLIITSKKPQSITKQEPVKKLDSKTIIQMNKQNQITRQQSSKKNKSYHQNRQTYKQNICRQDDLNMSKRLYQKSMKHTIEISGSILKKSAKVFKAKSNPINQQLNSSLTTHQRLFGIINRK